MNKLPAEKLFQTYMDLISKRESEEISIEELAGRCGYANASKFSEVFKKNEGLLPKDWRK